MGGFTTESRRREEEKRNFKFQILGLFFSVLSVLSVVNPRLLPRPPTLPPALPGPGLPQTDARRQQEERHPQGDPVEPQHRLPPGQVNPTARGAPPADQAGRGGKIEPPALPPGPV